MTNQTYRGYLYLAFAAAIYGLFGIFSKQTDAFGFFTQAAIRYGIICTFLAALVLAKKVTWRKIEHRDIKWFAI